MEDSVVLENLLFHLALSVMTLLIGLVLREKLFFSTKRDQSQNTEISVGGGKLAHMIAERCNALKRYEPVSLWGKNGHIQTVLLGIFGRFGNLDIKEDEQRTIFARDGATVVYDVFREPNSNKEKPDTVIVIVPGIGNNSRTVYIRRNIHHLVKEGFVVVVINHLGTRKDIPLTSPRIFTYGGTDDLVLVIEDIMQKFHSPKLIGLGFSMGGNLLLKLLGENAEMQAKFIFAASICQGYDIKRAAPLMMQWTGLRRGYNYAMCRTVKKVLEFHKETFQWWKRRGEGFPIDWQLVSKATSIGELDEVANRYIAGYRTVDEYYHWNSSCTYAKAVKLPILFINALDDPLVPKELFTVPREQIQRNPNSIFVITKYGGHLGFFKGRWIKPDEDSWLDDAIKEFVLVSYDLLLNAKKRGSGEQCA